MVGTPGQATAWDRSHVCSCVLLMLYKKGLFTYFKCVYVDIPFYFFPSNQSLTLSRPACPFSFAFPFILPSQVLPHPLSLSCWRSGSPCTTEESCLPLACSQGNLTGAQRTPRYLVVDVFKKVKSERANRTHWEPEPGFH